MDTTIIRTTAKSQAKINYSSLTEINSRYHGLPLMRTLTQGAYGVCYKESGLYMTRRVSSLDTTRRLEYMDYQDDPNRTFYDSNLCLFSKNMIFWWVGSVSKGLFVSL